MQTGVLYLVQWPYLSPVALRKEKLKTALTFLGAMAHYG